MKIDFTQHISELLTGLIALVIGWLGKGRFQKKVNEADLTAKIQAVYKEMVPDIDAFKDELTKEVKTLKDNQKNIEAEWRKKLQMVENKWQTKYSRLQAKYTTLQKEFEDYKKKHK